MTPALRCQCGHTKAQHEGGDWLGACARCRCGAYYNATDLAPLEEDDTPDVKAS